MLRSLKELEGYRLVARDGWSGKVYDFLFDDMLFNVRYLVADTGRILPGRRVLLSPSLLQPPDWVNHRLPVRLTRQEVRDSPDLSQDEPVSLQWTRQAELEGRWPLIWTSTDPLGMAPLVLPSVLFTDEDRQASESPAGDPHLRSVREVLGYHIRARDEAVGHLADFIVEVRGWILRWAVIDTRNWLPGSRKVLLSPGWLGRFDEQARTVSVAATRERIEQAPEFDPAEPVNRAYEVKLYDYYGRPVYWDGPPDKGHRASG